MRRSRSTLRVALFVGARARSDAAASFELTAENAEAVAAICRRLDGLPLALELAAARLRLLSPEALLERLDHALDVLTSGPRDTPERQQTLRATIDWSHSLLDERSNGCSAAWPSSPAGARSPISRRSAPTPARACLDELESLVDKALVQAEAGDGFRMLQTIGEFAKERLDAAGETDEVANRHARRYAAVAREIRDGIEGTDQLGSVERGIAEEATSRPRSTRSSPAAETGEEAACEAGMQLCGDLWMYWHIRGKNVTAREYAAAFLAAGRGAAPQRGSVRGVAQRRACLLDDRPVRARGRGME